MRISVPLVRFILFFFFCNIVLHCMLTLLFLQLNPFIPILQYIASSPPLYSFLLFKNHRIASQLKAAPSMCFSVWPTEPLSVPEPFTHTLSKCFPAKKAFGSELRILRRATAPGISSFLLLFTYL